MSDLINIEGPMVVRDPCYEVGVKGLEQRVNFAPATYHVTAVRENGRNDGRIYALAITNGRRVDSWQHRRNCCPVDSGQLGVYPEGVVTKGDYHDEASTYKRLCDVTDTPSKWGTLMVDGKALLVTSSGYGDGTYDLMVGYTPQGFVNALVLQFMDLDDVAGEIEDNYPQLTWVPLRQGEFEDEVDCEEDDVDPEATNPVGLRRQAEHDEARKIDDAVDQLG